MATQQELNEARDAYHKLVTGRSLVSVSVDGVTTQYTQADIGNLRAYIENLEAKLGGARNRRGPARVF